MYEKDLKKLRKVAASCSTPEHWEVFGAYLNLFFKKYTRKYNNLFLSFFD